MTNPINDHLINLAYDIVNLGGKDKQIDFGKYTDRQGELHLCWSGGKFSACLTVFSEPRTIGYGSLLYPPETTWREEDDEYQSVKIQKVADWLKEDWGFEL